MILADELQLKKMLEKKCDKIQALMGLKHMLPWYNLSLLENYLQVVIFCSSFLLWLEPFLRWNPICLQNSSYLWIIHICDLLLNAMSFCSWDTRSNNSSKATHTVDAHTAEVSEVIVVLLHKVIKKIKFHCLFFPFTLF